MAILYGTQSNGETLPVLVDQFGNLLAKGIDGEPGPPGPPGVGELPSDPYEGALLGWENGELAWVTNSVVLPAGTYGPYEYDASGGVLTVPQEVNLPNGRLLYMSDAEGNAVTYKPTLSPISSINGNTLVFSAPNKDLKYIRPGQFLSDINAYSGEIDVSEGLNATPLFDGSGGEAIATNLPVCIDKPREYCEQPEWIENPACKEWSDCALLDGSPMTAYIRFVTSGVKASQLRIPTWNGRSDTEVIVSYHGTGQTSTWSDWTTNRTWNLLNYDIQTIQLNCRMLGEGYGPSMTFSILLDGEPIKTDRALWEIVSVDQAANSLTVGRSGLEVGRVLGMQPQSGDGSVLTSSGNAIVLRTNNGEWLNSFYVTAPEQRIAARKVAANKAFKQDKTRHP